MVASEKILGGQTDGHASLDIIKQHLAILYTSGQEWMGRMKRFAERARPRHLQSETGGARTGRMEHHRGRPQFPRDPRAPACGRSIAPAEPRPVAPMTGASARSAPQFR
ncbi:protein of unknown function [Bradyrhizobium vignae]|uniref:Uncharacterized protein n=1 Tax=Bradyrhizobium vignae TaxID=1549949 RepID=A0A2U3Q8K1_9BRAD|nr:protein of unknown function [Bradyrhizobium vignae]